MTRVNTHWMRRAAARRGSFLERRGWGRGEEGRIDARQLQKIEQRRIGAAGEASGPRRRASHAASGGYFIENNGGVCFDARLTLLVGVTLDPFKSPWQMNLAVQQYTEKKRIRVQYRYELTRP